MAGNSSVADIYQGGYSALNSDHESLFTGYRGSVEKLGTATDARSANVLKEFSDKLTPGQKVVELSLGVMNPDTFEAIPKQHLKEINRLSKLTGVEPTVHGPLFDASGYSQQRFDEGNREVVERKILNTIERSHELNPDGNMPITFHSANELPATRYGKDKEGKEEIQMMLSVNQDTGQVAPVEKRKVYRPNAEGEIASKEYGVEEQLKMRNETEWDQALQQLIVPKEHADRIINESLPVLQTISQKLQSDRITVEQLAPEQQNIYLTHKSRFENAQEQLKDIQVHLNSILDKGYKTYEKNDNDAGMNYLKNSVKEFTDNLKSGNSSQALQGFMESLRQESLEDSGLDVPKTHISANEFAIKESAKTYGNVAWESYKKFTDKSPIISIENPPATMGLSRAEDIKKMVESAQDQFVENAVAKGMSEKDAEKQAKKLIGATWDVGHINQLRQFGFSSKDIIKEAETIAPLVKHVHLSDNFGMENTELPMGMGNVDLKEVMEKLGKQGEDARKIVEAAHWWQFQQTSPVAASMEAIGSPIYSMNMGPYWNETAGLQQGYFSGHGMMLPSINYETFGAGFSNLPSELGGQRPGAGGSRMGGSPME